MLKHPGWQLWLSTAGVKFNLAPVGILKEFCVGEAKFLCAGCSDEAREVPCQFDWLGAGTSCDLPE
jgi:hypothetical protein